MPRNGSGTYTLPQSSFVPSTTISSSAMNSDLSDIASALTASLSADGQTPITGPLRFGDGVAAIPSISFTAETNTGFIRSGTGKVGVVGAGVLSVTFDTTQVGTTGNQFAYGNTAIPVPVGVIQDFAGSTAPTGWLLCAAQVLAQTSYPELFAVCGTTYNLGGEGAGNFRLPDCRGRSSSGRSNMGGGDTGRISVLGGNFDGTVLGGAGGAQNQTLTVGQIPVITPTGGLGGSVSFGVNTGGEASGGGGGGFTTNFNINTPITIFGTSFSWTGNAFGGGQAHTILSPTIIFNKIIFAGRP